ncbi:MAG TPA: hypothetical protein PLN85_01285 [archaeon]|jgi:hypothetical protein|nr:hypothetical protein [archaeon]
MGDMLIKVPMQHEPKRKNRYFAHFGTDIGIETWAIRKFKRPSMKINKIEIPYMNEQNYVAGRYTWDSVNVTFLDPIGPSSSQILMEWVRLHAESITGRMGYAAGYKKTITLESLDPTGIAIEKWTLEDCQIISIDFGDNDYSSDDLTEISLELQPWRCILNM